MLDDDDHRGPAFHLRMGGDTLVKFNVEKKTKTAGTVDFAFGNFENSVAYSNFATADGLVYGTFEFAPMAVSWSNDLGNPKPDGNGGWKRVVGPCASYHGKKLHSR